MKIIFYLFINIFCIFQNLIALTPHDVNHLMKMLFEYHVDVKKPSKQLLERSLKIYLQNFDHQGIYLTSQQVTPYLNPSSQTKEQLLQEFLAQDFSTFFALDDQIKHSILKARAWRAQWIQNPQLLIKQALEHPYTHHVVSYASEESLLEQKHKNFFFELIAYQAHRLPHALHQGKEASLIKLCEKQLCHLENPYLGLGEQGEPLSQEEYQHHKMLRIIKALARSMDDHTAYYSREEAIMMRAHLEKAMSGIGVVLQEDIDGVAIVDMVEGGPALSSTLLQKGDRIVAIEGNSIATLSFHTILDLLKGEEGSVVKLGIIRDSFGQDAFFEVALTRKKIILKEKRLDTKVIPHQDGILGVLSLHSFYESSEGATSEKDIKEALQNLKQQGHINGIVLDMRDNTGGFLSQAIKVCSLFMNHGVVVISKYGDQSLKYFRSMGGEKAYQGPLVVLLSKNSASATEIVAQALQDYGIALVVGDEVSYGKGTIQYQTITDSKTNSFFKVTVGRYYTVSGRSTQIHGVRSDIIVPSHLHYLPVGEKHLEYALPPDSVASAYDDQLEDLDPITRKWFLKHYRHNLQKKQDKLAQLIPVLRKNSEVRIEKHLHYQNFLQALKTNSPYNLEEDLGLEEAILILKDWVNLQAQER